MNIDVDCARIERHEQCEQGKPAFRDEIAKGSSHCADEKAVLHRTAIDEQILLGLVTTVQCGQTGETLQANAIPLA